MVRGVRGYSQSGSGAGVVEWNGWGGVTQNFDLPNSVVDSFELDGYVDGGERWLEETEALGEGARGLGDAKFVGEIGGRAGPIGECCGEGEKFLKERIRFAGGAVHRGADEAGVAACY